MKKSVYLLFVLVIGMMYLGMVMVHAIKLDVATSKENYAVDEKINVKISLFDDDGNLLNDDVNILLKDAGNKINIEKVVESNKFVEIDLGGGATYGFWTIIAMYDEIEVTGVFSIEQNEIAKFEIHDDQLTITNIGNTRYSKTIQIVIGDTVGVKEPNLGIGEKATYRLIAPEGNYNVRITDGKTSISRGNVPLTGRAIGILDQSISNSVFLVGGVNPIDDDDLEDSFLYTSVSKNTFFYVFIFVILAGSILLSVERVMSRRAGGKDKGKKIVKKKKNRK